MSKRNRNILISLLVLAVILGLLIWLVLSRRNNKHQRQTNEVFSISNCDYTSFEELYDNVGWMGEGSKAFSFELNEGARSTVLADFSDGSISSDFLQEWSQEGNEFLPYFSELGDCTLWERGAFSDNESYIYLYDEATSIFYLYVSLS